MGKTMSLALIFLLVIGCTASMYSQADKVRVRNRTKLNQLRIGLNKEQILDIMGTKTDSLYSVNPRDGANVFNPTSQMINNPYKTSVQMVGDSTVEVIYYYTELKSLDGSVTDDELTPLILVNDTLIGWGWIFLEDVSQKFEVRIR